MALSRVVAGRSRRNDDNDDVVYFLEAVGVAGCGRGVARGDCVVAVAVPVIAGRVAVAVFTVIVLAVGVLGCGWGVACRS